MKPVAAVPRYNPCSLIALLLPLLFGLTGTAHAAQVAEDSDSCDTTSVGAQCPTAISPGTYDLATPSGIKPEADPLGRAPSFTIHVTEQGRNLDGSWYQNGFRHQWLFFALSPDIVNSGWNGGYDHWAYGMAGTNGDDRIRAQKYKNQGLAFEPEMPDGQKQTFNFNTDEAGVDIYTGGGNDTVYGSDGNDLISPNGSVHEKGRTRTYWALSQNELGCWKSATQKQCEALTDTGRKRYYGMAGNDLLQGGSGNDFLDGGHGIDILYGGAGDDVLRGSGGHDYLYGEAGNDRLYGGSGHDFLYGGDGNDFLWGGRGKDRLHGGAGSDFMNGAAGRDIYDLYGNEAGDRDVILADRDDNIRSQPLWQGAQRIAIGEVALPNISLGGWNYTLDANTLKDFAHRVDGADIVYRARN